MTRDKRSLEGDGRGGTEQGAYVFFALPSCNIMNMFPVKLMKEESQLNEVVIVRFPISLPSPHVEY